MSMTIVVVRTSHFGDDERGGER